MSKIIPIIVFHWNYIDIGLDIYNNYVLDWINKYSQTILIITTNNKKEILKHINESNNVYIHEYKNKGMDIGPFIKTINFIYNNLFNLNNNFYVIKIHTKKDQEWRNFLISHLLNININIDELFNDNILYCPHKYIYELDNINKDKTIFLLNNYLNYNAYVYDVIDEDNYTKYEFDPIFYIKYNKLNVNYDENNNMDKMFINFHFSKKGVLKKLPYNEKMILKKKELNCSFPAGTMFGINFNYLITYFNIEINDKIYELLEEDHITNVTSTYTHSLERIFGILFNNYD